MKNLIRKTSFQLLIKLLIGIFAFTIGIPGRGPVAYAQVLDLPAPGTMVTLSEAFTPLIVRGVKIYPENPFQFNFIVDVGNANRASENIREESRKLIYYFLAGLTIPQKDIWVNLSPYEADKVVSDALGQTVLGRDLLAQDYLLKQVTASLIYPEKEIGKSFWDKVYKKAFDTYGVTDVPVNTFNKVWVIPDKAVVAENADENTAFVAESHLKVMLEEDYLALQSNLDNEKFGTHKIKEDAAKDLTQVSTKIIREIIIPELEKEVNQGTHFAPLRQIYHSLILASWYKDALRDSFFAREYFDQEKTAGIDVADKAIKEKIYQRYLEAYQVGVYSYITEEFDMAQNQMIPRKYFSGGHRFTQIPREDIPASHSTAEKNVRDLSMLSQANRLLDVSAGVTGSTRRKVSESPVLVPGYENRPVPVGFLSELGIDDDGFASVSTEEIVIPSATGQSTSNKGKIVYDSRIEEDFGRLSGHFTPETDGDGNKVHRIILSSRDGPGTRELIELEILALEWEDVLRAALPEEFSMTKAREHRLTLQARRLAASELRSKVNGRDDNKEIALTPLDQEMLDALDLSRLYSLYETFQGSGHFEFLASVYAFRGLGAYAIQIAYEKRFLEAIEAKMKSMFSDFYEQWNEQRVGVIQNKEPDVNVMVKAVPAKSELLMKVLGRLIRQGGLNDPDSIKNTLLKHLYASLFIFNNISSDITAIEIKEPVVKLGVKDIWGMDSGLNDSIRNIIQEIVPGFSGINIDQIRMGPAQKAIEKSEIPSIKDLIEVRVDIPESRLLGNPNVKLPEFSFLPMVKEAIGGRLNDAWPSNKSVIFTERLLSSLGLPAFNEIVKKAREYPPGFQDFVKVIPLMLHHSSQKLLGYDPLTGERPSNESEQVNPEEARARRDLWGKTIAAIITILIIIVVASDLRKDFGGGIFSVDNPASVGESTSVTPTPDNKDILFIKEKVPGIKYPALKDHSPSILVMMFTGVFDSTYGAHIEEIDKLLKYNDKRIPTDYKEPYMPFLPGDVVEIPGGAMVATTLPGGITLAALAQEFYGDGSQRQAERIMWANPGLRKFLKTEARYVNLTKGRVVQVPMSSEEVEAYREKQSGQEMPSHTEVRGEVLEGGAYFSPGAASTKTDNAMLNKPGGIDFERLNVDVQRDIGVRMNLIDDTQSMGSFNNINGLTPIIFSITPVSIPSLNLFLGLNTAETDDEPNSLVSISRN